MLNEPTGVEIESACLALCGQDFELLNEAQKKQMRFNAKGWLTAWQKTLTSKMVPVQKEHQAMFDRLKELEEVSKNNERIYWTSCGEYLDGSGDLGSEE